MKTVHISEAPMKETPHKVDVRPLADIDHVQLVHITLQPGEALRKHVTPVDVHFYILEGHPTIEIGDEMKTLGKDHVVESPARVVHRILNESHEPARILVIKTPKPKERTQIL